MILESIRSRQSMSTAKYITPSPLTSYLLESSTSALSYTRWLLTRSVSHSGHCFKLESPRQKDVLAALGNRLNLCFIVLALWCCRLAKISTLQWDEKLGQNEGGVIRSPPESNRLVFRPHPTSQKN